jgi:hypothetical protein
MALSRKPLAGKPTFVFVEANLTEHKNELIIKADREFALEQVLIQTQSGVQVFRIASNITKTAAIDSGQPPNHPHLKPQEPNMKAGQVHHNEINGFEMSL